jgi:hypothetical protein
MLALREAKLWSRATCRLATARNNLALPLLPRGAP